MRHGLEPDTHTPQIILRCHIPTFNFWIDFKNEFIRLEVYWFVGYVREGSSFRALSVTFIWDNVIVGSGIPGFEIIGLLLALTALLVVSLKKKNQT